jgi:uncharacterized protein (TIGR02246 family)
MKTIDKTPASAPTQTSDEVAVRAVLGRLYEAWAAGDADAFVAEHAADATSIVPGSNQVCPGQRA